MYRSIISVDYYKDYKLILFFDNNEKKIFDALPYLSRGKFKELLNVEFFKRIKVSFDTIEWENGLDMDPEFLYQESHPF